MRKLLVLLLAVFAISGVSYTQDEQPVTRSLGVYLDIIPGHLTEAPGYEEGDDSRIFSNNEFEFGVRYSQNFATATWLSMWVKFLIVGGMPTVYDINGNYQGNGPGPIQRKWPRAQVGLNFGGYAVIAMDTRGLIAQENYYSVDLPGNGGAFTFVTILEFWAVPQGLSGTEDNVDKKDWQNGTVKAYRDSAGRGTTVVDLFALKAVYAIGFAPGWRYSTNIQFRFSGGGGRDGAADTFFQDGFSLRWENQINWSVTDSFGMWARVRYHIANVAPASAAYVPAVDHQVSLLAGLSYSFDFSDN